MPLVVIQCNIADRLGDLDCGTLGFHKRRSELALGIRWLQRGAAKERKVSNKGAGLASPLFMRPFGNEVVNVNSTRVGPDGVLRMWECVI